jgi:hypothetical protein
MAIKFLNTATGITEAAGDNSTKIATTAYVDAAAAAVPIGDYVTLATTQTISGAKTFSASQTIFDGNVGIGTTSPTQKLDVNGNIGLSGNGTGNRWILLNETNTYAGTLRIQAGAGSAAYGGAINMYGHSHATNPGDVAVGISSGSGGSFRVNSTGIDTGTDLFIVKSSGNVGIGTTSPAYKLDVESGNIRVSSSASGEKSYTFYEESGGPTGATVGYDGATNSSSGNVGIGTTSPSTTLQLTKANTEVLANQPAWPKGILEITDTSAYNAGTGATIVFRKKRDSTGNQVTVGAIAGEGVAGDSRLSFWTGTAAYMGTAPKMVIDDSGNVGIGTTSPTRKFVVSNAGASGIEIEPNYVAGVSEILSYNRATSVYETMRLNGGDFEFQIGGSETVTISGAGAVKFNNYSSTNNTGTPTYLLGTDASGNIVKTNTVPGSAAGPYLPLAGGTMTGTSGVLFPDNFKLNIGTGSDLQIYHDGSNSFIEDVGTGSLLLKSNGSGIYLKGFTSTDTYAQFLEGGAVNLYYDNSKKFETTSTGVTVTGIATATSFATSTDSGININGITLTRVAVNSAIRVGDGLETLGLLRSYAGLAVATTGNFGGTVTAPTFLGDLNGTINTVTTAVTKANSTNDTTVATTAFVQNLIGTIPAGLVFQGTWNAATNTPTLTSGTGTTGNFYIVSVDGQQT